MPLAGIARVLQLSESWLQQDVNAYYGKVSQQAEVAPKTTARLVVQMDELWSFVDAKGNKQWVWLAIDAKTREMIGCHVGDRSTQSAQALWDSLPRRYRQYARLYTDHWEACACVLPSKRPFAVDKDSGLTSHIERLNHTLRQRLSRLVRLSLSFSKKLENHIGAAWNFIHHYNQKIREKLQWEQTASFSLSFT
jgi:IS1 family transposase